jgi:excisionase family DNA binding protein
MIVFLKSEPLSQTTGGAMDDTAWTAKDVAAWLGVSVKTVYAQAGDKPGQIPGRRIGRQWRFDQQAVRDWLRSGVSQDQQMNGHGTVATSKAPVKVGNTPNPYGLGRAD